MYLHILWPVSSESAKKPKGIISSRLYKENLLSRVGNKVLRCFVQRNVIICKSEG